jgi:acyl-CoA synthetase (NDP forming)
MGARIGRRQSPRRARVLSSSPPRPVQKLDAMLSPRSIAVMGVSEKLNPGHTILNNILREGFDRARVYVIKPGATEIEGCRCVPDIASLPEAVDLLILSVDAAQVPGVIEEVCRTEKAQAVIAIPGGLGEKAGTEKLADRIKATLAASRTTAWAGPIVNGGNCLGIRSRPGHYDTLFIPEYKLPPAASPETPLAMISQSGAYAICILSKLGRFNFRYLISVGNQADLTVGDYLTHLAHDDATKVYACYVEGFVPGDRQQFIAAARTIVKSGRRVLLYVAGRTSAGKNAARSHTASRADNYVTTKKLALNAGVVVAETIGDFEDLCRLAATLPDRKPRTRRLAGISNAGFECVALADNLGGLELAELSPGTRARLAELLKSCRVDAIVGVQNPLDLTPMAGDTAFAEAVRACLEDDGVDAVIVGCVPLTGRLNTLASSPAHREDLTREDAWAMLLAKIARDNPKPMLVATDCGAAYDALAACLEEHGIPCFRTIDQATRMLALWST